MLLELEKEMTMHCIIDIETLGDAKYEQLVLKTFIEMIENAQK